METMSLRKKKAYLKRQKFKVLTVAEHVPTGKDIKSLTPDELVEDPWATILYEKARMWAKGSGGVDEASIFDFTMALVKVVELMMKDVGGHHGQHKIRLVMTIVRLVIENDVVWPDEATKTMVSNILELSIPNFIRTMILIAKGEIDLGKTFGKCCKKKDDRVDNPVKQDSVSVSASASASAEVDHASAAAAPPPSSNVHVEAV